MPRQPVTQRRLYNIREFRKPNTTFAAYEIPDGIIRIDRKSRWGNPYTHLTSKTTAQTRVATRGEAIARYRDWLIERLIDDPDFIEPLRGKGLACWCTPLPCHGDVLLEMLDKLENGSD